MTDLPIRNHPAIRSAALQVVASIPGYIEWAKRIRAVTVLPPIVAFTAPNHTAKRFFLENAIRGLREQLKRLVPHALLQNGGASEFVPMTVRVPITRTDLRPSKLRNMPCACGSGKKTKHCCK